MTKFSSVFILISYKMNFTDVFTDPIYDKTVFVTERLIDDWFWHLSQKLESKLNCNWIKCRPVIVAHQKTYIRLILPYTRSINYVAKFSFDLSIPIEIVIASNHRSKFDFYQLAAHFVSWIFTWLSYFQFTVSSFPTHFKVKLFAGTTSEHQIHKPLYFNNKIVKK